MEAFQHFVDGRDSINRLAWGITKYRYIASISVLLPITAITPLPSLTFSLKTAILVVVSIFILALLYLHKRIKRSLGMKHSLHMIAHMIRDKQVSLHENESIPNIEDVTKNLCLIISDYFQILTDEEDIGVAIRVAIKKPDGIYYRTIGRAGLNENRSNTSEDLACNEGLAMFFNSEAGRHGVLVINDMKGAKDVFKYDFNSKSYPNDITTMMTCPINGWDGNGKGMLGILFVTSRKKRIFGEKHTDSMGFISDALATILSDMILAPLKFDETDGINIKLSNNEQYKISGDSNEPIKIT